MKVTDNTPHDTMLDIIQEGLASNSRDIWEQTPSYPKFEPLLDKSFEDYTGDDLDTMVDMFYEFVMAFGLTDKGWSSYDEMLTAWKSR